MAKEKDQPTTEQTEVLTPEVNVDTEAVKANVTDAVTELDIVEEIKTSYINYAMSVIVARALPDARDGLKPVQRRILWGMHQMGVNPGTAFKKVARIVGDVMGKYHPHGDGAIQDALVRLAQDWNMRYTLVQRQGNFGSIDGDKHAAMRYIEARLDKNAAPMLEGLDKNTVNFLPNFDGLEKEPVVLPTLMPNLLLNGSEGIAVGMATKIPPHNLGEVVDAMQEMILKGKSTYLGDTHNPDYETAVKQVIDIDNLPAKRFPTFESEIEIADILKHIKGPDFPTGGEIYDTKEIANVYETGRGRILMRGVSKI
ncbi:hypothetical protein KC640_03250, partial [Candidatus Dojkabacteria bacterium]|nr:hypothetical protein [Candidatus Dojkabacteria bacterium]